MGQQVIRRRWDRDGGDTQTSLRKGSAGKTEQGNDSEIDKGEKRRHRCNDKQEIWNWEM